jgi:hypothetical protein
VFAESGFVAELPAVAECEVRLMKWERMRAVVLVAIAVVVLGSGRRHLIQHSWDD